MNRFFFIFTTFITIFLISFFLLIPKASAQWCDGTGSWGCCTGGGKTCSPDGCIEGSPGCTCSVVDTRCGGGQCNIYCGPEPGTQGSAVCTFCAPASGGGGNPPPGGGGAPPPPPPPPPPPADLVTYNFDLTDSSGTVKTIFHVGERIYVKLTIENQGGTPSWTSNGRTYTTFYHNKPNQINSYDLPSDPSNFYLDTGVFYVGDAYTYGSYPSHPRQGQFPGVNYLTQAYAGDYTSRVFVDYDGRVTESTNFGNNQATQGYTVKADITGRVAFDANKDGQIQTSDPGIADVYVEMYKKSGTGNYDLRVGSRRTDSTGLYQFLDRTEGDYQITITVPANYQMRSGNPRTTNVGPDRSINFLLKKFRISGKVFIDYDKDNVKDTGEPNYTGGATMRLTGAGTGTIVTNGTGDYAFEDLNEGNFAVHLDNPSDYDPTGPVSRNATTPPDVTGINFGIFPKYTIAGGVFVDDNGNGKKDGGESYYAARPLIKRNGSTQFVTRNIDGTYLVEGMTSGTYTITYESLPAGYFMVHPRTTTPPSFTVTVGPGCVVSPAPPGGGSSGTCDGSNNVTNLNYAIKPGSPWLQAFGLDVRFDEGISNPIPASPNASCGGKYTIVKTGNAPGIFFTGDTASSFGQGLANERNFLSGGSSYPETFAGAPGAQTKTSYAYLEGVAKQSGITPTNIVGATGGCSSLSSCSATASLANGVYLADGNLTIQGFTAGANRDYVLLVNGNLTIAGNISVPIGSTLTVSTKGTITVTNTVGAIPTCPAPTGQIQGFYSTDTSFLLNSTNDPATEKMLNLEGAIVVNASRTGGTFQNNRDLGTNNISFPSFTIKERPDMILNAPTFIKSTSTIWQEVAP